MQNTVRTFKVGKLKPDTFAEPRILGQPPGVVALLVSFNRFPNYVVTQLAEINEGSRFTVFKLDMVKVGSVSQFLDDMGLISMMQGMSNEDAEAKRDNDLFQARRLIICGLYVNILHDYVRVTLNL